MWLKQWLKMTKMRLLRQRPAICHSKEQQDIEIDDLASVLTPASYMKTLKRIFLTVIKNCCMDNCHPSEAYKPTLTSFVNCLDS